MHLLDYSFYMYLRQFVIFRLAIASKLGFHLLTKAILVAVSTSPPKQPPVVGPWQLKIVGISNALELDYAFYMYWRQFEMLLFGLASKLGLHPVAIAHLSTGTSS
jgi:hypothetical protein